MKILRVRIKNKNARALDAMAGEGNLVWNFCNELSSYQHTQRTGKFFSVYDMAKYTAGASKAGLAIHSQTVQAVTYKNDQLRYAGQFSSVWGSYSLANDTFRSGSFSQDAGGRWYANLCVEVPESTSAGRTSVGIDLGLKDLRIREWICRNCGQHHDRDVDTVAKNILRRRRATLAAGIPVLQGGEDVNNLML